MGANLSCCNSFVNLMKLDPTTGAIIWKKKISFDGTLPKPIIQRVEPLRGTNDVLVSSTITSSFSELARVSSSGTQAWYYKSAVGYSLSQPTDIPTFTTPRPRYFGSDGSNIVFQTNTSSSTNCKSAALDYTGAILYVNLALNTNVTDIVVSSIGAQFANIFSTAPKTELHAAATGTLISSKVGAARPVAVNQTTGIFLGQAGTSSSLYNSLAAYAILATSTILGSPAAFRWCPAGIVSCGGTGNSLVSNTTLLAQWIQSTVLGSACASIDCDADTTGAYFAGLPVTTSHINVYKRSLSYSGGTVIWAQNLTFDATVTPSKILCCCLSDDGYLYVGGGA